MDLYDLFDPFVGVTTDSRSVSEGQLFFALHGPTFDGNLFAGQALSKGARAAVVDRGDVVVRGDGRYVVVDDTLRALQGLALQHRRRMKTTIVQITGTNGKTTTKELVAQCLSSKLNVVATQGNLNNHIGVPLTLLRLLPQTEVAVVETGANHPGEIGELTRLVEPQIGIVTNVQKAHLEGFGTLAAIVRTKTALYDYLRRTGGTIVYNSADPVLSRLSQGAKRVAYGADEGCRLVEGNPCTVEWHGLRIETRLVGGYNAPNIAAALKIGELFDVGDAPLKQALESYIPRLGRSQIVKTGRNTIVLDAYNANPSSMRVALQNFFTLRSSHKAVVLGQMNELGEASAREHQALIDTLALLNDGTLERVVLVGSNFDGCNLRGLPITDLSSLDSLSGYTILIKGSNSNHLDRLVERL